MPTAAIAKVPLTTHRLQAAVNGVLAAVARGDVTPAAHELETLARVCKMSGRQDLARRVLDAVDRIGTKEDSHGA